MQAAVVVILKAKKMFPSLIQISDEEIIMTSNALCHLIPALLLLERLIYRPQKGNSLLRNLE